MEDGTWSGEEPRCESECHLFVDKTKSVLYLTQVTFICYVNTEFSTEGTTAQQRP
jgi:hypothetical protein